jgi:hypothetical protein
MGYESIMYSSAAAEAAAAYRDDLDMVDFGVKLDFSAPYPHRPCPLVPPPAPKKVTATAVRKRLGRLRPRRLVPISVGTLTEMKDFILRTRASASMQEIESGVARGIDLLLAACEVEWQARAFRERFECAYRMMDTAFKNRNMAVRFMEMTHDADYVWRLEDPDRDDDSGFCPRRVYMLPSRISLDKFIKVLYPKFCPSGQTLLDNIQHFNDEPTCLQLRVMGITRGPIPAPALDQMLPIPSFWGSFCILQAQLTHIVYCGEHNLEYKPQCHFCRGVIQRVKYLITAVGRIFRYGLPHNMDCCLFRPADGNEIQPFKPSRDSPIWSRINMFDLASKIPLYDFEHLYRDLWFGNCASVFNVERGNYKRAKQAKRV